MAHTNLTEINEALDLYWRNDIPAGKVNLGLGFYGRSFQLTDPSCYKPGCLFKGGGSPGVCSDSSGTLTYREIMQIIDQYSLEPYYDQVDEVKYVTWNSDQWVSYDDKDTFQAKIDFANKAGLGGLLIWALDQDTAQLDALAGVIYPERLGSIGAEAEDADNWANEGGGDCRVTDCGTTGCGTGEVHMTDQRCDGDGVQSSLCCPFAAAPDPKTCTWRGTSPLCNGRCHPGEVALESNPWGDGHHCNNGLKFYCCAAAQEVPDCRWTGCGGNCDTNENKLTWAEEKCFNGIQSFCCSKSQDWQNCQWHGKGGSCFDDHCPTGHSVSLTTNYEGQNVDCGVHHERKRSFCCDPPDGKSPFLPVPLDYLFPNPPTGDDVTTDFTLKVDPTYGGSARVEFGDEPEDSEFGFIVLASPQELQVSLDKRDGSHWELFDCFDDKIEGAQTVRMMCTDFSETSNCDKIHLGYGAIGTIVEMPKGCGPGKYAVVKDMSASLNQMLPEHLVKRDLDVSTIYDLTFDYDFSRVRRDDGQETQMRIDYSNEPGYWDKVVDKAASKRKRDLSGFDGNHKRWLEQAWHEDFHGGHLSADELHKRWFGSDVISWLQGLIDGVVDVPIISNSYQDDFTVLLIDESVQGCAIGPEGTSVSGRLNVQATTHVELETNFGFTLITTLGSGTVSFDNSYLYFRNRGEVSAKFTVDALTSTLFQSPDVKLLSADQFGAAFAVPGIVTIGPNFQLFGSVQGQLTLGARFESNVNLAKWDIRQTYPDQGSDWDPVSDSTPNRDGTQETSKPDWQYSISASGFIEAHVKPTVTFGIDFNKNFINTAGASVNLVADGYIRFHADASTAGDSSGASSTSFCYGVDAGADLYATINAPSFNGWKLPRTQFPLAATDPIQIIPTTCPIDISSRDLSDEYFRLHSEGSLELLALSKNLSTSRRGLGLDHFGSALSTRDNLVKRQVYGPVITLGIGCPDGGGGNGDGTLGACPICGDASAISKRDDDDTCYLALGRTDESTCPRLDADKRDDHAFSDWTDGDSTGDLETRSLLHPLEKRVTVKTNAWTRDPDDVHNVNEEFTINFQPYYSCGQAANRGDVTKWFGFDTSNDDQKLCEVDMTKLARNKIVTSDYQTDHILETQTILHFFDFLRGSLQFKNVMIPIPDNYVAASDEWVNTVLMGLEWPGSTLTAQKVLNGVNLLDAITDTAVGGDTNGGPGRMALLYADTNRIKGSLFSFKNPAKLELKLRRTKILQRNVSHPILIDLFISPQTLTVF